MLSGRHHTRQDGALMSVISRQTHHAETSIAGGNLMEQAKRIILAPIVHKHDLGTRRYLVFPLQTGQLFSHNGGCFLHHLLLVIAGHHQI